MGSQLVPNPFNWSPNSVFYRYLSIGHSNQKIKKTRSIYFLILLLAGLSSPSQLVPNPFNWSPTHSTGFQTVFFSDISVSVAQIKKNQKTRSIYFFYFASGRTFLTQSTGPQPIQLVPKQCFFQISQYRSLKSKKIQKTRSIYFLILLLAGLC